MKRLFVNIKERLQFFRNNPVYSIRSLARELTWADERFLAEVTECKAWKIRSYLDEPFDDADFAQHIRRTRDLHGRASISTADLYAKKVLIQYAIVRALKPDLTVETGVANGVSSSYLLLAMEKNQKGHLHSIEVDDSHVMLEGRDPGWIVPESLRLRWSIHMGPSELILPDLLKELPPLDIFIHDSLHTYSHMMLEFETAFPYLRPGGLLLADDATWNTAFPQFAANISAARASIVRGVGVLRTNDSATNGKV
jgi:predicted O-methyltransferase YrrM